MRTRAPSGFAWSDGVTESLRGPLDPRACVVDLQSYDPPENPARLARRLGVTVDKIVKLDANENPYGPTPLLADALAKVRYHEYIDPDQEDMRRALSEYVGIGPEHLIVGNGSDELIDLLMRTYLDPGDEILSFAPTFGMYAFNASQYAAIPHMVERDERFDVPMDSALAAIGPRTRLIFVTAPNNPTGNQVSEQDVRMLLDSGRLVVLDEAYAEFAGRSLVDWVPHFKNLIVLRTFSKWAALAGLRAGYGALPLHVAAHLWKLKPPFNVNVAAEAGILASLADKDYLLANVGRLVEARERLFLALSEVPYLRPYPSQGSYILSQVVGRDARAVRDALAERGILVRHYSSPRLAGFIRVTAGRGRDNEALLDGLASV
jgi:histidinol-phosphate aminotransferase